MPYARQNWTKEELSRLLQNPVKSKDGPNAHSKIHAVQGELAKNEKFQHARVMNQTVQYVKGKLKVRSEAKTHTTMDCDDVAAGLCRALNHDRTQPLLKELDGKGNDKWGKITFHVNFKESIGRGIQHTENDTTHFDCISMFVYLKPNKGNADLPIIQTVVPKGKHEPNPKSPKDDKVLSV